VTGYKDTSDAASLWAVKGAKVILYPILIAWHQCACSCMS